MKGQCSTKFLKKLWMLNSVHMHGYGVNLVIITISKNKTKQYVRIPDVNQYRSILYSVYYVVS